MDAGAQKISESRGEGKAQTEDAKSGEEAYHEENKSLIALNNSRLNLEPWG